MGYHRVHSEHIEKRGGKTITLHDCSASTTELFSGYRDWSQDGYVLEHPLSYYRKNALALPRNPYRKVVIETFLPKGFITDTLVTPNPLYCSQSISIVGDGVATESDVVPGPEFNPDLATIATNMAIQQANSSRSQIGADVGERRQTSNMILGAARRLGGAFNDVRHGNFKGAARQLGVPWSRHRNGGPSDIGSAWLSMQYGWLPLLSDVYNTIEALHPIDDKDLIRAVGHAKDTVQKSYTFLRGGDVITRRYSSSGHSRCELCYFVSDKDLLVAGQLGLTNPLQVAWEVVPYSFIIDWFVPIGTYFESLGNLALIFRGGSVSLKSDTRDSYSAANYGTTPAPGYIRFARWDWGGSNFSLTRTVIDSNPAYVPLVKNPWSTAHGLNFAALLSQLLSPFRR
jgi:hypothetical protein